MYEVMKEEHELLKALEEEALALTQAAVGLSHARQSNDNAAMISALDNNLRLWIGIKTVVNNEKGSALPAEIRGNLTRLSEYTAQKTFELGSKMNDATLETLIHTNLQISEGLLEGMEKKKAS